MKLNGISSIRSSDRVPPKFSFHTYRQTVLKITQTMFRTFQCMYEKDSVVKRNKVNTPYKFVTYYSRRNKLLVPND